MNKTDLENLNGYLYETFKNRVRLNENLDIEIKHCITAIKRDALQFQLEEVGELISAHLKTTSDNWESELNDLFTKGNSLAKELRALR